ncbi:MAG: flagellin FliC [Vampirovibrio sp.]|nr:flagellin FliC [Vampirovibrio sp.]
MMMGIIINTNIQSLNAQRLLSKNTRMQSKSYEKLASGFKINKASDDAAGLQISESLRTQIRGSQQAGNNVQDGINVLNIMDGTMQALTDNLQRMRELTVQAANDTYSTGQRSAITSEISQLAVDINRIAAGTQFNGRSLLDGSISNYYMQVGANYNSAVDRIDLANIGGVNPFDSVNIRDLVGLTGTTTTLNVMNSGSSLKVLERLDSALQKVNNRRASLGAMINRLDGTFNNLSLNIESQSASESRIRNTDVAKESAELTRNQVLQQASAQILSQANQIPQLALQLLQQ